MACPAYPEKFIGDDVIAPFSLLSVVHDTLPASAGLSLPSIPSSRHQLPAYFFHSLQIMPEKKAKENVRMHGRLKCKLTLANYAKLNYVSTFFLLKFCCMS